jgi:hypothetical protein
MSTNAHPTTTTADEVITIPTSGASYPAFLEPLTPNELSLLKMYDTIKQHEREAAILKAEEAKRRLEEADERYRAKVLEREKMQGVTTEEEAINAKIDKGERRTEREQTEIGDDDHDNSDREADDDDMSINERKRKRESEISQLRQDVSAAKQARRQKAEEKLQAKKKAEDMRRELLGESNSARVKITAAVNNKDEDDDEDDGQDDMDDFDSFDVQQKQQTISASTGPSIKKKQRISSSELDKSDIHQPRQPPSLIANILTAEGSTPIHDFSKQLSMSNDKLTSGGSIIFPIPGDDKYRAPWTPPDAPMDFIDGCLELMLTDLAISSSTSSASTGNNTLAIKFQAPAESERFSINIATSNKENERYDDILFHFNPRQFQKGGQLVINDRQETRWGNDISIPLSTIPLIFGAKSGSTLIVQINIEGFDVYVDGVHCARLEHRVKLPDSVGVGGQRRLPSLRLQFPSSNDYGDPENWLVHRVWWGYKPSMFDESTLDRIPGVNIVSAVHPRKLFISGLSRLFTDPEVDLRKAELERAFRKYGGPTGAVAVSIQKNSGFAFVDVASEELADLAVAEMANNRQYRVNKARRTRHEALLEERAARETKEAEEGGGGTAGSKETAGWD